MAYGWQETEQEELARLRGMEARLKRALYTLNGHVEKRNTPEYRETTGYSQFDVWYFERDMVEYILAATHDIPKPEDYEGK